MVFKIRFYLKTPVIIQQPLHLDALLAAVHPAMHGMEKTLTRRSEKTDIVTAPLPLDSVRANNMWIWCCSAAIFGPEVTPFFDNIVRTKTDIDFYNINRTIQTSVGADRNRMFEIRGVICEYAEFFYSTRHPGDVARVARRIKSLGMYRRMGYGSVDHLETIPVDDDWRICLVRDGRSARNLPAEMLCELPDDMVRVTPPYWIPHLTSGIAAGEPCALNAAVRLHEQTS